MTFLGIGSRRLIGLAVALVLMAGAARAFTRTAGSPAVVAEEQPGASEAKKEAIYAPLAWLIGSWRGTFLPEGVGAPPSMSFEWSQAKDFIRYSSVKPDGQVEYEGMIVWNPVERRFVFLKSYRSEGSLLMENGWIDVLDTGGVRFNMQTHYTPGDGLPWSRGKKAGPNGTTLRFRRTLTPDGSNRLWGEFLMDREGSWTRPDWNMDLPKRGFEWLRSE